MNVRNRVYRLLQCGFISAGLVPLVPKLPAFALKLEKIAQLRSHVAKDMQQAFFDGTKRPVYK